MRLTPEQAARLDADAVNTIAALPNIVEFFHGEEMPFSRCDSGNTHAWRCRVLDLLADVKALRERAEMAQWRPIESAPKDGTPVVALGNNFGDPSRGHHVEIVVYDAEDECWHRQTKRRRASSIEALDYLTHWQPIPAPPAEGGAG